MTKRNTIDINNLTPQEKEQILTMLDAYNQREEEEKVDISIIDIAITKGHSYAQGYNTYLGKIEDREGYMYLKQGFTDGFLAGFAHRMVGGHG
jgi:hypothetical protein